MKYSKFLRFIAASAALQLAVCGAVSCGNREIAADEPVQVYTVERQDLQNFISVSGTVKGSDRLNVTSDITAKVVQLNVEVGSQVKEGDVLCVFDSTDLQTEYDNLKKTADNASGRTQSLHDINQRTLDDAKSQKETSLARAQHTIDNAVKARDDANAKLGTLEKDTTDLKNVYDDQYNALIASGVSDTDAKAACADSYTAYLEKKAEYDQLKDSMSDLDDAVYEAQQAYDDAEKMADSAIQSAQDTIDAEQYEESDPYEAQLSELQSKIDRCTVKAAHGGIVTALNIAEGSIPTTEAIMTIEDDSKLSISVNIEENDILKINDGQRAVITTTATGDEEFEGKVGRVVKIISGQAQNTLTGETVMSGYSAEIELEGDGGDLLIGMNAKVKIILEDKEDILAVPYDAINDEGDGAYSVFIAEDNGGQKYTVKSVAVEKGLEGSYFTEVISDEISEGDIVITQPGLVSDGDSIEIVEGYYEAAEDEGE